MVGRSPGTVSISAQLPPNHTSDPTLRIPVFVPRSSRPSPGMHLPLLSPFLAWLWYLVVRALLAVVAAGPVPAHCAFVMDGNRRFARLRGRPVFDGHLEGFDSLKRVRLCFSTCSRPGEGGLGVDPILLALARSTRCSSSACAST